jgi:hypothetical protein
MSHAECSPSGADRWMTCTKSVSLIRALKARGQLVQEEPDTDYAAEGTAAHSVRQQMLEQGTDAEHHIGETITIGTQTYVVDEEMADAIQPGVDWVREIHDKWDVELKVRLDSWLPGQYGFLDTGAQLTDTLIIDDFKYGVGEPVDAEHNRQLMLYALGYWHHVGRPSSVRRVIIVIDQPRAGGTKFWEISLADLREFGREVARIFLEIRTGNTELRVTAKGCRFCPVRSADGGCPAYNKHIQDVIGDAFADEYFDLTGGPFFREPGSLTPEQRARIALNANAVKNWVDKVAEQSLLMALDGQADTGTTVVLGKRGNRFFSDEARATEILVGSLGLDAFQPVKLIPLSTIERKLKPNSRRKGDPEAWTALEKLIDRDAPKPALAAEGDKRRPFFNLNDEFEDL